jgi:lipopolysaccharide export LptBFGC system permease protein LptF
MTTAGILNTAISGSNVQNNSFRYKEAVTSFFRSGQVRSGVVGVLILNMYLLFFFFLIFYFETKKFFFWKFTVHPLIFIFFFGLYTLPAMSL